MSVSTQKTCLIQSGKGDGLKSRPLLYACAMLLCFVLWGTIGVADNVDSQLDRVMVTASEGSLDEAIDDINFMMLRNSRSPRIHYVSGVLFEEKGDLVKAMQEYRKAYELLQKKSHN